MSPTETVAAALLGGSTTESWGVADLVRATALPRALAELAVEHRATRHLVTEAGYLLLRWTPRR
jgi:hypothetical protein